MKSCKGAFIFIESNTTGTGQLICEKVIERGFKVYLVTSDKSKYHFLSSMDVVTLFADTASIDSILKVIEGISDIKAVFSTSEYYVGQSSRVAEFLGLRTHNTSAIETCRNKYALYKILKNAGVSTPETSLGKSGLCELKDKQGLPLVMKPKTGSGSCGVKLLKDIKDLEASLNSLDDSELGEVLLQEYIEGSEYSVETVTAQGKTKVLGIVAKTLSQPPYFVETSHVFPCQIEEKLRQKIEIQVLDALDAIDFRFGFSHTEVRVSGDKVFVIEINPRLAGGMIPSMLGSVFDVDLLEKVIDLWLTLEWQTNLKAKKYGQISFLVAPKEGRLSEQVTVPEYLKNDSRLVSLHNNYELGRIISLNGDFRDRLAALITTDSDPESLNAFATSALEKLQFKIELTEQTSKCESGVQKGRVNKFISPSLQRIVYGKTTCADSTKCIERLFTINDAHLVMLSQTGLIDTEKVSKIIRLQLDERNNEYRGVKASSSARGIYMAIEDYISAQLGVSVGGLLQTARSRNDINATVTKLLVRESILNTFTKLKQIRSTLIYRSSELNNTAFPVYSQYQPAQPSTLATHFLAIEAALARESQHLILQLKDLEECPLGACAGGGTTLPIDTEFTAKLLGFSIPVQNSLDAVSGRDNVQRFVSSSNQIGTVLSRFAQDLQHWTTYESNLIKLPDELVGGSSLLPQKRNPYLIEYVKSSAAQVFGEYCSVSQLLSKTPYTNSYEVSSMIENHVTNAESYVTNSLSVFNELIAKLQVNCSRLEQICRESGINATTVANFIQKTEGISFREAHERVGLCITAACDKGESIHDVLLNECPELELHSAISISKSHKYGGGAGVTSDPKTFCKHGNRLIEHCQSMKQYMVYWQQCDELRDSFVKALSD